ncbi:MAG TPA: glycosyltransferase family 2 protein [Thermohalobaculum sp.]|nr:glycosyltransferase family 2 protein [Thermohalobaculum sp.]
MTPRFTVIAPMLNEAGNVAALAREIGEACAPLGAFEAIFVNDGSTDATARRIAEARGAFPWLREVRHEKTCGQSAALRSGVLAARAPVVCTLDGDGQNPPSEIPGLLAPLLEAENPPGLVAGQRRTRRDSASRRLASAAANRIRSALLGDATRDTGCGLKAIPRDVFLALPFFDHMHRYIPALVRREGLEVRLVDVGHRPRTAGVSKYGNLHRAYVGAGDLIGVWWLMRRRRLPVVVHEDP